MRAQSLGVPAEHLHVGVSKMSGTISEVGGTMHIIKSYVRYAGCGQSRLDICFYETSGRQATGLIHIMVAPTHEVQDFLHGGLTLAKIERQLTGRVDG